MLFQALINLARGIHVVNVCLNSQLSTVFLEEAVPTVIHKHIRFVQYPPNSIECSKNYLDPNV